MKKTGGSKSVGGVVKGTSSEVNSKIDSLAMERPSSESNINQSGGLIPCSINRLQNRSKSSVEDDGNQLPPRMRIVEKMKLLEDLGQRQLEDERQAMYRRQGKNVVAQKNVVTQNEGAARSHGEVR